MAVCLGIASIDCPVKNALCGKIGGKFWKSGNDAADANDFRIDFSLWRV